MFGSVLALFVVLGSTAMSIFLTSHAYLLRHELEEHRRNYPHSEVPYRELRGEQRLFSTSPEEDDEQGGSTKTKGYEEKGGGEEYSS